MKLNSKEFRQKNYFILYDINDNIICYFENFDELSKHLNYRCSDLVFKFNKFGNTLKIIIGNEIYKLFTCCD